MLQNSLLPRPLSASRWEWLPLRYCHGQICLQTTSLPLTFVIAPVRYYKGQSRQPAALVYRKAGLLGMHPAGNGLLDGGRSLRREYAQ